MNSIKIPLEPGTGEKLRAGDEVLLTGTMYSARDQAHASLVALIGKNQPLPLELENQVIYYMGPSPTPEGAVIGSCGPTTSSRMDPFTPAILAERVSGIIGKGPRSQAVIDSLIKEKAVYFYSFGGCGALYSQKIKEMTPVAFPDLGPEAIYKLVVEDFPVIVGIDSKGNSVF